MAGDGKGIQMSTSVEHLSFLIRLWRERVSEEAATAEWHIEVEHIQSGQRREFGTFDELMCYLRQAAGKLENSSSLPPARSSATRL